MKNLKKIRVLRDLTQIQLQMETGINQSILSKYETGEYTPTTENLLTLAAFYKTSVDFLLDLTDEEKPYPRKKRTDGGT
ncbi:helix-turn-helix domain-containing protein [Anaerotruncus rubiinfantis]|uniref:helix-turn-helix domain-containing protein n=1 Tax=Anaerotruncus rubiinfantis TaxID=1720200 RepID=UPI0008377733|nr:helix-turn-helix transcriptional regulator [Anaerotruncus rubiinfantis]